MQAFRGLLALLFVVIAGYSGYVMINFGPDFASPFLEQVQSLTWPGQFGVDFMTYLWLSALWVAWRSEFSPGGVVAALIASVAGMLFFAPYVLYLTFKAGGDVRVLLLGEARARA